MKVILLTDVPKVGNKYDVKDFKDGYAKNVLLAKGLAVLATKAELQKLEDRKRQIEKKKEEEKISFKNLISKIDNTVVTIKVKANEKGHLFKSVGPSDVASAIKEITGIVLEDKSIQMDHIKELGLHTISIKRGDLKGECQIKIEAI